MSDLEERKLDLEMERLDLERQKFQLDSRFTQKNLGVVLTAAVSLAAVIVSASQVWVADVNRSRELELANIQKAKELELARLEGERRWKLDLTDFLFRNKQAVFSGDQVERERVRNVLLVTFPPEITGAVFEKLEATAPEEEKTTWREARTTLAQLERRRLFLQFLSEGDRTAVGDLANELRAAGYAVPGIELVEDGVTEGDVRYYHPEDAEVANAVKMEVQELLEQGGVKLSLTVLSIRRLAPGVQPGTIEVWLPRLTKEEG